MTTRNAMFAGSWYPGTPEECRREIDRFVADAETPDSAGQEFRGGIVPHAGWYFSGAIACNVIRRLAGGPPAEVVAIFGTHLHPGSRPGIMTEGSWETPFGNLTVNQKLGEALLAAVPVLDNSSHSFIQDNTIELQLPFVRYFFKNTTILPIAAPPSIASVEIGRTLARLAIENNISLRVIGSTDLTHYGPNYGFTGHGRGDSAHDWVRLENDRKIIRLMEGLEPEPVIHEALASGNACCAGAAAAAIAAGKELGAQSAETIAYATSYDRHPSDSFVGYVGILF